MIATERLTPNDEDSEKQSNELDALMDRYDQAEADANKPAPTEED